MVHKDIGSNQALSKERCVMFKIAVFAAAPALLIFGLIVVSFVQFKNQPKITYGHKYKVIDGFYKGCTGYALVPKDYSVILDGTICGNTKPGAIEVDNRYLAEIAE
jgi:hypothetical protein